MAYEAIFRRVEKKYLMDQAQWDQLQGGLAGRMEVDQYGRYRIYNLYLDTPDFYLTRRSLERPVYKEKMRLRSYGRPQEDSTVYLEIKKKYKGTVYKRRMACPLAEAMAYLAGEEKTAFSGQIFREIDAMREYYNLSPQVYLAYDRMALAGVDTSLRLTVDTCLDYRLDHLNFQEEAPCQSLLGAGRYLMEVKALGGMPLWMCQMLSDLKIRPETFSKVGQAYQQTTLMKRREAPCLIPSYLPQLAALSLPV